MFSLLWLNRCSTALLRRYWLVGLLLGAPGLAGFWPAAGQAITPAAKAIPYPLVEQRPQLPGGGGMATMLAAVQQRIVLPANALADRPVFARFVVGTAGQIEAAEIVMGTNPTVDAAVLAAVRQLPTFVPGRQNGQPVRVECALNITLPNLGVPPAPPAPPNRDADERVETRTLLLGEVERKPGEADSTFARRVLPLSYADAKDLLSATWRPSAYGKQLFFSLPSTGDDEQAVDLVLLDPFAADTYAVRTFAIPALSRFIVASQGEATAVTALFFADVNQDGQKELLVLSKGSQAEPEGWKTYHQTQVFQYLGLTSTGRPQYYEDTAPRDYLDGLATVSAVRQALAQHQARSKAPLRPAAKAPRK
jgi:hypothetical protein